MRFPFSAVFVIAALVLAALASVSEANRPSLLVPGGWKLLKLDGKQPARFVIDEDRTLRVSASSSVGFYYRELDDRSAGKARIRWRWRVDRQIPATDQSVKGKDDRAIAVHLWFDDDTGGSVFGVFNRLLGRPKIGHLISYVWGGVREPGAVMANPYYDKGAIIVLRTGRSARTGRWYDEMRDVAVDYERVFGTTPDLSKLRYIAISADTDDTGTSSSARVADVELGG